MRNENKSLALLSAIIIVLGLIISVLIFDLPMLHWMIVLVILAIFYLFLVVFLLSINQEPVIEYREYMPVFEEKVYEQPVYEQQVFEEKKENEYVTSNTGKTYHEKGCRLAKMIKKKNRVEADNKSYFSRKGYKACKTCLK